MEGFALKDYLRETGVVRPRLVLAGVAVVLMVAILFARVWYLQVFQYDRFTTLSQDNRIRLIPIPPVRGQIYDRKGRVLAENQPVYALEVLPTEVGDMDVLLDRLARLIELSGDDIEKFRSTLRSRPDFEVQTLKLNLSDHEVARFTVNQHLFKGVQLEARLQRFYPYGAELVHVLGYVGRISERDLERIDEDRYQGSRYIGKLGIESQYEDVLLGQVGYEQVETNAHGRNVRVLQRTSPVAGDNLRLSIDAELQIAAREYLGDFQGAVVAVEPATGAILSFISNPVYDPNAFVNGIDSRSYNALRNDDRRPLLNRALNGRYAPGSTIKGLFGLASLDLGYSEDHLVSCPGYFRLKGSTRQYRCWKHGGHGAMDLRNAITQSCDVYFYTLANAMGIDEIHKYLTLFGLGVRTGIDLENEPSGLVPSREWKQRNRNEPWYPGETVSTGIGQGFTLVTPLQLAMVAATLANRGGRIRASLVQSITDTVTGEERVREPELLAQVSLSSDEYYETVIAAMEAVVHSERGTARRSGLNAGYRFAGKSGTVQVIGIAQGERYNADEIEARFRDHALFIAFAPVDDPRIAVAVIAENGGGGSATAAPVARRVMDHYLLGADAVEFEPLQSPVLTGQL